MVKSAGVLAPAIVPPTPKKMSLSKNCGLNGTKSLVEYNTFTVLTAHSEDENEDSEEDAGDFNATHSKKRDRRKSKAAKRQRQRQQQQQQQQQVHQRQHQNNENDANIANVAGSTSVFEFEKQSIQQQQIQNLKKIETFENLNLPAHSAEGKATEEESSNNSAASWNVGSIFFKSLQSAAGYLIPGLVQQNKNINSDLHEKEEKLSSRVIFLEQELAKLQAQLQDKPSSFDSSQSAMPVPPPPMVSLPPPPPPPLPPMPNFSTGLIFTRSKKRLACMDKDEKSARLAVSLDDIRSIKLKKTRVAPMSEDSISENNSDSTSSLKPLRALAPLKKLDIRTAIATEAKDFRLKRSDITRSPGGTPFRPRTRSALHGEESEAPGNASMITRSLLKKIQASSPRRCSPRTTTDSDFS